MPVNGVLPKLRSRIDIISWSQNFELSVKVIGDLGSQIE